jgi:tRNA modification GTPase
LSAADTIAAIATPPGVGGVGIVRVSGPKVRELSRRILGQLPQPRHARLGKFRDKQGQVIDEGICLFFPSPHSFTGEDVVEFQCHGGAIVLDQLLQSIVSTADIRIAHPGEFSQRAFLNGKLDLAQAEAIADLIESSTDEAARLATRTLQGEFSHKIDALLEQLIALRVFIEAAVDFPDEEVDFLADEHISNELAELLLAVNKVQQAARQGQLLRDGMTVVIAGPPNAGKSSLLNVLAGKDAAIVTQIAGTTRDLLRERIQIDGMPLHIVDTAGLRQSDDPIEQEGIRRARQEISQADRILWVYEATKNSDVDIAEYALLPRHIPITLIKNKIDLMDITPFVRQRRDLIEIGLSAKSGDGIELLTTHLKQCVGYQGIGGGEFLARRRHLEALERAKIQITRAARLLQSDPAAELIAEELRLAQRDLSEITGEFLPDDLLGEIFGKFCIGK